AGPQSRLQSQDAIVLHGHAAGFEARAHLESGTIVLLAKARSPQSCATLQPGAAMLNIEAAGLQSRADVQGAVVLKVEAAGFDLCADFQPTSVVLRSDGVRLEPDSYRETGAIVLDREAPGLHSRA